MVERGADSQKSAKRAAFHSKRVCVVKDEPQVFIYFFLLFSLLNYTFLESVSHLAMLTHRAHQAPEDEMDCDVQQQRVSLQ